MRWFVGAGWVFGIDRMTALVLPQACLGTAPCAGAESSCFKEALDV